MPERAVTDIRQYSAATRGGHYLAFEEPRMVADDDVTRPGGRPAERQPRRP